MNSESEDAIMDSGNNPEISVQQNVEISADEVFDENLLTEAKRKFFKSFFECIHDEIFLDQDQKILNDVEIHCEDGILRAPSLLVASVSPLFKATAPGC